MTRFLEAACCIIIVLLAYIILRQEKFISFTETVKAKDFNFKHDMRGYSEADVHLKNLLNT